MKPRDAFEVIVRAMGLGSSLIGILGLIHLVIILLGLPPTLPISTPVESSGLYLAFGLAVLIGAPQIVRLIYGRDSSK